MKRLENAVYLAIWSAFVYGSWAIVHRIVVDTRERDRAAVQWMRNERGEAVLAIPIARTFRPIHFAHFEEGLDCASFMSAVATDPVYGQSNVLANVAIAAPVPLGFAQQVDGKDGERIGTNVATWAQWKAFFDNMLAADILRGCIK